MSAVYVDVVPELLQWAVTRAGWDQETALKHEPRLEAWLQRTKRPTLKQLQDFARATHTPLGMLFLPEAPVETVPIPDMRTMGDGGVAAPSPDLLDTIYLCQRRQDWFRDYAIEAGAGALDIVGTASLAADPAKVAADIRTRLRMEERSVSSWSQAMRDLIDRIEALGILVMVSGIVGDNTHRALDPKEFRGFTLADDIAPLIFVNGVDSKAAQVFTLVHELAHVWLGHSALSEVSLGKRSAHREERWCNEVAAEVLVPLVELEGEYQGPIEEAELSRLARHFKVSTLVVLNRLHEAGHLSWEDYRSRYAVERERVVALAREPREDSDGGNYYYTQRMRLGRQFARAVIQSTLEGTTTYRDAYRLLGAKKHSTFEGLAETLRVA